MKLDLRCVNARNPGATLCFQVLHVDARPDGEIGENDMKGGAGCVQNAGATMECGD
jgi:hypothetical protein